MSVRIDENTDHMKYTDDMEAIDSDIMDRVIAEMNSYDADIYTAKDVKEALAAETCSVDNFKALLSPAALPFLEEIAQKAQKETRKHFGNSVAIFTPLYIANYCENYCVYCGFNCHNKIKRIQYLTIDLTTIGTNFTQNLFSGCTLAYATKSFT